MVVANYEQKYVHKVLAKAIIFLLVDLQTLVL